MAEAIASAAVGFIVWDEDRHYTAANARACELLGQVNARVMGVVLNALDTNADHYYYYYQSKYSSRYFEAEKVDAEVC